MSSSVFLYSAGFSPKSISPPSRSYVTPYVFSSAILWISLLSTRPQAEHTRSALPFSVSVGFFTVFHSPKRCPVAFIIRSESSFSFLSKCLPHFLQSLCPFTPSVTQVAATSFCHAKKTCAHETSSVLPEQADNPNAAHTPRMQTNVVKIVVLIFLIFANPFIFFLQSDIIFEYYINIIIPRFLRKKISQFVCFLLCICFFELFCLYSLIPPQYITNETIKATIFNAVAISEEKYEELRKEILDNL